MKFLNTKLVDTNLPVSILNPWLDKKWWQLYINNARNLIVYLGISYLQQLFAEKKKTFWPNYALIIHSRMSWIGRTEFSRWLGFCVLNFLSASQIFSHVRNWCKKDSRDLAKSWVTANTARPWVTGFIGFWKKNVVKTKKIFWKSCKSLR